MVAALKKVDFPQFGLPASAKVIMVFLPYALTTGSWRMDILIAGICIARRFFF